MITRIDQEISELVVQLCEALRAEAIDYCHWKSNAALDRSATGENDLDLLVSRSDAQRFIELLLQFNFKEAYAAEDGRLPGIRDFYGYDKDLNRVIHVHAHFQLVLGHDFTKNYHLPLENAYLRSATQGELFKVPSLEFELAILVIRMVIKHCTLDTILMRHGALSKSEKSELEYLKAKVEIVDVAALIEEQLPAISPELFKACIRSLEPRASFWRKIATGRQLRKQLTACSRRPLIKDLFNKFTKRVTIPFRSRLHLYMPKKRLANGGLLIAVIGGDGSGKTTAIKGLSERLAEEFEVVKFHMGKPRWSFTTILIRGLIKIGRSLGFYPFIKEGSEYSIDTDRPKFPGYPWLIREVCTAHDRLRTYIMARRFATNGALVICDRFPLSQVKIMDGPQVERVTKGLKPNRLIRYLAKQEKKYYEQIMLPDLLTVLRVHPEVSVARKTDEPAASVRSRAEEVWKVDWSTTPAQIVDASRGKNEVVSELMSLIWSKL